MSTQSQNRIHAVNHLSDGITSEHKSYKLLNRWRSKGGQRSSWNRRKSAVSRVIPTEAVATTSSSLCSSSQLNPNNRSNIGFDFLHGGRQRSLSAAAWMMSSDEGTLLSKSMVTSKTMKQLPTCISPSTAKSNVMLWMEHCCPNDIIPKILSFVGPQTVTAISRTSKHWNSFVKQESTWRVMCEDLYKVSVLV